MRWKNDRVVALHWSCFRNCGVRYLFRPSYPVKDRWYEVTDVEQLIKERLETQRKRVEENNAFDQLNLNDAKARVDELEKLLEEVQQEQ